MTIKAPVPLNDHHVIDGFDCGVAPLDVWLKRRARANAASGASHTYVACDGDTVVAYYALAAGAFASAATLGRFAQYARPHSRRRARAAGNRPRFPGQRHRVAPCSAMPASGCCKPPTSSV